MNKLLMLKIEIFEYLKYIYIELKIIIMKTVKQIFVIFRIS